MDRAAQQTWMAQWRGAAVALADQRATDLCAMTDAEALAASEALLALVRIMPLDPARSVTSGLVRQQELFHRARA